MSSGIDISVLFKQQRHNVGVTFLRRQVEGSEPILEKKHHNIDKEPEHKNKIISWSGLENHREPVLYMHKTLLSGN